MPVNTGFLVRCTLRPIACQLVETVRNNVTIEWGDPFSAPNDR